jgi:hypothetical protein
MSDDFQVLGFFDSLNARVHAYRQIEDANMSVTSEQACHSQRYAPIPPIPHECIPPGDIVKLTSLLVPLPLRVGTSGNPR